MKKFLMTYLMVNCKEATYLMGLKEEGKLSLPGRLKLRLHTSMCAFCKRFEQQTTVIRQESLHLQGDADISAATREKLDQLISDFEK